MKPTYRKRASKNTGTRVSVADRKAIADSTPAQGANALTNSILQFLSDEGCHCWRNNSGALKTAAYTRKDGIVRGARMVRFGQPGSSDIIGYSPEALFIAVEVKAGRDRLSPVQTEFLENVNAAGGIGLEARDLEIFAAAFTLLRGERAVEVVGRVAKLLGVPNTYAVVTRSASTAGITL